MYLITTLQQCQNRKHTSVDTCTYANVANTHLQFIDRCLVKGWDDGGANQVLRIDKVHHSPGAHSPLCSPRRHTHQSYLQDGRGQRKGASKTLRFIYHHMSRRIVAEMLWRNFFETYTDPHQWNVIFSTCERIWILFSPLEWSNVCLYRHSPYNC